MMIEQVEIDNGHESSIQLVIESLKFRGLQHIHHAFLLEHIESILRTLDSTENDNHSISKSNLIPYLSDSIFNIILNLNLSSIISSSSSFQNTLSCPTLFQIEDVINISSVDDSKLHASPSTLKLALHNGLQLFYAVELLPCNQLRSVPHLNPGYKLLLSEHTLIRYNLMMLCPSNILEMYGGSAEFIDRDRYSACTEDNGGNHGVSRGLGAGLMSLGGISNLEEVNENNGGDGGERVVKEERDEGRKSVGKEEDDEDWIIAAAIEAEAEMRLKREHVDEGGEGKDACNDERGKGKEIFVCGFDDEMFDKVLKENGVVSVYAYIFSCIAPKQEDDDGKLAIIVNVDDGSGLMRGKVKLGKTLRKWALEGTGMEDWTPNELEIQKNVDKDRVNQGMDRLRSRLRELHGIVTMSRVESGGKEVLVAESVEKLVENNMDIANYIERIRTLLRAH